MKRVLQHPEEPETGRKYWRSLGQMQDTEESREWIEREFPEGVSEMTEDEASVSRRSFMKLMGAATSMAGVSMAACRRPESYIKPYSQGVEWIIPGKSLLYATAMPWAGGCVPLVVTTHEGRPTHLQGNKLHPLSNGGLDAYAQSSVLDLYDPDRSRGFVKTVDEEDPISKEKSTKRVAATREEFDAFFASMKASAAGAQGKGLALLLDHDSSPTRRRLLASVQAALPQAKVYRYEAISGANLIAATEEVFSPGVRQLPQFAQADKVLALDCDFMGTDRLTNNATSQFMSGRRAENPGDAMNRLYVLEGRYTVTGGMADHRLRVNTSQTMKAAVAIATALADKTGNAELKAAAAAVKLVGDYSPRSDYEAWLDAAAADLAASPGKAIVVAGAEQPKELHLLVAAMNAALGAFGATISVVQAAADSSGALADLAASIGAGEVENLVILGEADPVYDAPADLNWEQAQRSVQTVVHVGRRNMTATARAATWHVPGTHYLEQWGDGQSADGTYSVIQPMILPLYDGISDLTFLGMLVAEDAPAPGEGEATGVVEDPAYLAVRETFGSLGVDGDIEAIWSQVLRDGFLADSAYDAVAAPANTSAIAGAIAAYADVEPPSLTALEVTFVPDSKIYDGRFVNNGWLQEAPDPISKITWDNVALMSLKTAEAFGVDLYTVDEANMIKVVVGEQTQWFPVLPAPGHVDNAITIALGYGQGIGENGPGRVGDGVGVNANVLRTADSSYWASGADVLLVKDSVETPDGREIGKHHEIATTQEHHTVYGRAIVREGNLEDFNGSDEGFFVKQGMDAHIPENTPLYKPLGRATEEYPDGKPNIWDKSHQWAMTIDLSNCIGCNSCLIACQSENNIPIVGKDQVRKGREMHWIRMDRYFAVDLDGQHQTDGEEWERLPTGGGHDDAGHGDGHGGGHAAGRVRELDDPEMLVQPMACQQCESASCETVCPVNATVHSPDGLNVMAYNRCIGTRYCANNCPYKARRFNFFDYNKRDPLVPSKSGIPYLFASNLYDGPIGERQDDRAPHLQKNPNVTVRMRGVMEKCTYCIQRIQEGKINAKKALKEKVLATGAPSETLSVDDAELRVATDSVKTACQIACPADAIVFGNKVDPDSAVNKTIANRRNYSVLQYVGNIPRTTYLARIKNPNPELLKVSEIEKRKVGQASSHIH